MLNGINELWLIKRYIMTKHFSKFIFLVLLTILLFSCKKEPVKVTIPITDLTVSPVLFSLNVDSTYIIKVTISPPDATNKSLIWKSSNSDIAIVDSSGLVRGIKPGTDTIKVTTEEGNKTSICIVIVTKWITYTNSQLSTGVNTIAIDGQGNKWFGTTGGGVSKFDGTRWTTYNSDNSSLLNNLVTTIAIDPLGNNWFGTVSGVSKFDGANWTNYNTTNSSLADNQVNSIAIDGQGNKWFGTLNGISKFDDNNWTTYNTSNSSLADNYISYIAIDVQGNKWIATATGISKFDGMNWTTYTGLAQKSVANIVFDLQEHIWLGTIGNGVSTFDGINWTTYNTSNSMLSRNSVYTIEIDSQGNKWFGTEGGGVSRYDDTNWITFTKNNGLGWDYIYSMAIDAEGNKWFGYYNGVTKLIDH
jgi:ligand-binding sensor domain-containing protein